MNREVTRTAERDPVDREGLLIDWLVQFEEAARAGTPVAPAELCRDHPALLPEFEQVLQKVGLVDVALGGELDHPIGSDPLPPDTARYRFLAFLARGGMGEVYRGVDRVLKRVVALKVLRRRLGVSGDRFRAEAELVAGLSHPGIVPVYDCGELADGRPFFAMKLIEGRTLEEVLVDAEARGESPAHQLQRFEQVCQAVAYAHGLHPPLLHRDLKPQNVMVGAFGEVQVMDWGIARTAADLAATPREAPFPPSEPTGDRESTADSPGRGTQDQTKTGAVKGTWAYMAPEQARGLQDRIGPAADVFALGGILCRILTGRPTYAGSDVAARAAAGDLAETFARLDRCGATPELVALAKQFLHPDVSERIPDAAGAAAAVAAYRSDLEERLRHAETDRVRAEARAAEQRKRRRVQVALAAAVLLLVAGGGLAGWWYDREAERRRSAEDLNRLAERERVSRNEQAMGTALGQAEDALRRDDAIGATLHLDQVGRRSADGAGEAVSVRFARCKTDLAMLQELDRIDDFRWTAIGQGFPEAKRTAAKWLAAFDGYGITPGATDTKAAAERVSGSILRARLVTALDLWLSVEPTATVLDLLEAADPDRYRDAVRRAVRTRDGTDQRMLAARPDAADQPGHFVLVLGQLESLPSRERKRHLAQALRKSPGNFTALMAMAAVTRPGDAVESAGWYRAALTVRPTNVAAWNNLGSVLHAARDLDGAIAAHRAAIRLDAGIAFPHFNLGKALRDAGDVTGAVAEFREAVRIDPKFAPAYSDLGLALREQNDLDGAIAEYRKAVRADPAMAAAHSNLGVALGEKGLWADAVAAHRTAVAVAPDLAAAHDNLGTALDSTSDWDGAVASHRTATRLDPNLYSARHNLGHALRQVGDLEGAVASYQAALRIAPRAPASHAELGYALRAQGRLVESRRELLAAEKGYRAGAPALKEVRATLATVTDLLAGDERKLTEVLAGRAEPATAAEAIRLAQLCGGPKGRFALAHRLYADAFRMDAELKNRPLLGLRIEAARCAALAAEGQGVDPPRSSDRLALRRTAREWLADDLAARAVLFDKGPPGNRDAVHDRLQGWLSDPDLAGLRDPARWAAFPADERSALEQLWRDIEALRDRSSPPPVVPAPGRRGDE